MSNPNFETISTEILVIGGGGAAARAAIEAHEVGCKVLMTVKGRMGRTGSTATSHAMAFSAAMGHANPADSPGQHFKETTHASFGMCNEKLIRIMTDEAPGEILFLERCGVKFDKKEDKFLQYLGDASVLPRCVSADIETSLSILHVLGLEVKKRGIPILEGMMIIDLLMNEQGVVGAVALDKDKRVPVILLAKAVILASGGGGQAYSMNAFTPEMTGDGYACAYRAGASLINMEFIQIGPTTVYPKMGYAVTGFLWSLGPKLKNKNGEEFVAGYCPPGVDAEKAIALKKTTYPFSVRNDSMYVDIAMFQEIIDGRGTDHQGIHFDLTHADPQRLEKGMSLPPFEKDTTLAVKKRLRAAGIDLTREPGQIAPLIQYFNGGIRINEHGETGIPGLWAVGEVSGGIHGADRLGGNSLADCQVFGKRGGRRAAAYAKGREVSKPSESLVASVWDRAMGGSRSKTKKMDWQELWREIRESMSRGASVVRKEEGLKKLSARLEEIEFDILPPSSAEDPDPVRYLELRNIVQVARMVVGAARLRRESRGTHYRQDYPERDDKNWLKNIVLRQKQGNMTFETQAPVFESRTRGE